MKVIFSYLDKTNYTWAQSIELATVSNFLIQKQGFETIFWGNENALKKFGKINYTEKILLNTKELTNFPKCFWSVSKLLALSMMEEPCIHIDMDLLVTKPIPVDFLKNDIVCFHNENFRINSYKKLKNYFNINPKECESIPFNAYNCSLIGGHDISSIKHGIRIIFDFISNHKYYIDNIYFNHTYLPAAILIEQIWLFQIFKYLNKEINCLVEVKNFNADYFRMWKDTGYIHLISNRKEQARPDLKNFIKKHNIKCGMP